MGVISNQQQQMGEVPAVEQSTSGGFFNKEEVNETPAFTSSLESNQDQINIFNNPMKSEVIPMQSSSGEIKQENGQALQPQGGTQMVNEMMTQGQMMNNGNASQVNMMAQAAPMPQAPQTTETQQFPQQSLPQGQDMISAMPPVTPMPEIVNNQNMVQGQGAYGQENNLEQPAVMDNAFIANPMPLSDNTANNMASALETASLNDTGNIQFQEGLATNLSADLGIATGITPKDSNREVTKEEALEALETLNRYFKNTKELPSELANELNGQQLEGKGIDSTNQNITLENKVADTESLASVQSEPQFMETSLENNGSSMAQEQAKTLSLTPDIPGIVPQMDTNSYMETTQEQQNMYYQNPAFVPGAQETLYQQGQVASSEPQSQTGYIASSNGPAVSMSAAPANINDVPVTLPDNYNPQMAMGNIVMGPGSVPTENMAKVA